MEGKRTGMSLTIASVTPTLCRLFRVAPPSVCTEKPIGLHDELASPARVSRALVFVADAIGTHLVRSDEDAFTPVIYHAPLRIEVSSVMPSITPVCMASMFTGAMPEVHGNRNSNRRVLTCDTIFDAFARAGRKIAVATVQGSSIDLIFQNRPMDRFPESYDPEVAQRAHTLLEKDDHDLILVYQQEYDDCMHATKPRSPEALRALHRHIESFDRLASAARSQWAGSLHAIAFLSDHGVHLDPETGHGNHGSDLPEDLEVTHFWGLHR
jgi:hypothetical protein